jgi:tetratricopeptide (TPR) repeat protein
MTVASLGLGLLLAAVASGDETAATTSPPDGGAEPAHEAYDRDGAQRLAHKALARIKDGAWEEAAELLRRAREKDPRNAAITTDNGYALAHLGRREEAERLYRAAIELDPNRFYAYVNLAELWVSDPTRWQRASEMIAFLEKAQETLAADARARAHVELRLAELLRSLGRGAEARPRLQRLTGAAMPAQVRRRAGELLDGVEADGRLRTLADWPAPAVTPADRARLAELGKNPGARDALPAVDALVARWPAWVEARWQRARLLERAGQFDEASADLAIVVQLEPSHARAWRRLGLILSLHGGRFEAERADEALRHALALEPSWTDLRELRQELQAKRERYGRKPVGQRAPAPTAKARQLFQDAQSWIGMEAPEMAPPLLRQALAESPAFVEAAAALYAVERQVPEETVKALWNDGAGLWQLASQVGVLRSREAAALARPWLDRAVELDSQEARFARATLRAAAGDRPGALADLRDYVAAEPAPPRLEEARALRDTLVEPVASDSPEQLVHLQLLADRPGEALLALGGACRAGLPMSSLLALGKVHEFMGQVHAALDCYLQALAGATNLPAERRRPAWERLAAAAATLPAVELTRYDPSLQAAAAAKVPLAALSLARIAEARRRYPEAAGYVRAFLAETDGEEPRRAEALALQARVGKVLEHETETRNLRADRVRALAAAAVVLLVALLVAGRRYRLPLARALRSQPLLFPPLVKAVGQVRHDVLKHRGSALELLGDPGTDRRDVARALCEPSPASAEVAGIYRQLAQTARGLGLRLCRLAREPVFGPLVRDLATAEKLLGRSDPATLPALRALDERLRGAHADRLQDLLRAGPRTEVGAELLSRWIEGLARGPGQPEWCAPSVQLPRPLTSFPVPEAALGSMVGNLLRNAIAAVAGRTDAAVAVRVEDGRDGTGRRTVSLVVADSSPDPLAAEVIEQRPPDRGLGIVRETARTWGGEIVVRGEAAPFTKSVEVRFPAPPEVPR